MVQENLLNDAALRRIRRPLTATNRENGVHHLTGPAVTSGHLSSATRVSEFDDVMKPVDPPPSYEEAMAYPIASRGIPNYSPATTNPVRPGSNNIG